MTKARPFRVAVPDEAIDDLHRRIDMARWPDELEGAGWDYGIPLTVLKDLVAYWRDGFDWRAAESRINAFDQIMIEVEGLDIHAIHQRSPHADATPLLLTHGWPGSIVEFLHVIPRLTDPTRFGGRAEDAFHVVCPSLPGYGFSPAAIAPGMGAKQIAQRHLKLMTALGYDRFVAQGGDWGSLISRFLPDLAPERLIGLHLNLIPAIPPKSLADPMAVLSEDERRAMAQTRADWEEMTGYHHIQRTKPQTLAYALTDSPVGLAGWIAEKFHGWTDNRGDIRDAVSWDDVLTNISVYWFTGTIGSSMRLYYEYHAALRRGEKPGRRCEAPFGAAIYPKEIVRPPRAWVEAEFNLVHWYEAAHGGHFAALEQPEGFVEDLRAFRRRLRDLQG